MTSKYNPRIKRQRRKAKYDRKKARARQAIEKAHGGKG